MHKGNDSEECNNGKKSSSDDDNEDYCGVCGTLYEEETNEIEKWIDCDVCGTWSLLKYLHSYP